MHYILHYCPEKVLIMIVFRYKGRQFLLFVNRRFILILPDDFVKKSEKCTRADEPCDTIGIRSLPEQNPAGKEMGGEIRYAAYERSGRRQKL